MYFTLQRFQCSSLSLSLGNQPEYFRPPRAASWNQRSQRLPGLPRAYHRRATLHARDQRWAPQHHDAQVQEADEAAPRRAGASLVPEREMTLLNW